MIRNYNWLKNYLKYLYRNLHESARVGDVPSSARHTETWSRVTWSDAMT